MIKCSFCGYESTEEEAEGGCRGCPLRGNCAKTRCPNCGFEMADEPKLLKMYKKWKEKRRSKNDR